MSELLNPQTFDVTLPSHMGMPEGERPVFVFRTRSWRKTIELDEITARFRELKTDGEIAELLEPPIKELLVAEDSADIEGLNYTELVELFVSLRECERIELIVKKNSLLQSLSDAEKSVVPDAETVPNQRPSNSTAPAAEEKAAPAAAIEEIST